MKTSKMKRFWATFLAVGMVATTMFGCGDTKTEDKNSETQNTGAVAENTADTEGTAELTWQEKWGDEILELEILCSNPYIETSTDTVIGQWIEENFGIVIKWVAYPGDIEEKMSLMLAGGDYNALQYVRGKTLIDQYLEAEVLINLDDYKDIMPDFYERYAEQIEQWRTYSEDGGVYFWQSNVPDDYSQPGHNDILIRSDVLEYYGYPELLTVSDYTEFLKQALIDFPTTYTGANTIGLTLPGAESWGLDVIPIGYEKGGSLMEEIDGDTGEFKYDVNEKKFIDIVNHPEAIESFKWFNELYNEGILDEECFTDTGSNTMEKMSDGRALAVWYATFYKSQPNVTLTEAGHEEMTYVQLPVQLDSQVGSIPVNTPESAVNDYYTFALTDATDEDDIPRILEFINWCASEEGQLLLQRGIEGRHYEIDENGVAQPTELRYQMSMDSNLALEEGIMDRNNWFFGFPMCQQYAEDGQPYNFSYDQAYYDQFALTEREQEVFAGLGWENSEAWWIDEQEQSEAQPEFDNSVFADVTITGTDYERTNARLSEVRQKYTASIVMAEDFDAAYEEMLKEYNKADPQSVADYLNGLIK